MKPVRDTISLIADLTGILAFVGLSAAGLMAFMRSGEDSSWLPVLIVFVLCFVLPAVVYYVLKEFAPRFSERLFFKQIVTDKNLKLSAYELADVLPTDKQLIQLQTILYEHTGKWDKDAVHTASSLYLVLTQDNYLLNLTLNSVSVWKKHRGEFSVLTDGKRISKVRENFVATKSIPGHNDESTEPFYSLFPDWREKAIKLYGPMENNSKKHLYINISAARGQSELQVSIHADSPDSKSV